MLSSISLILAGTYGVFYYQKLDEYVDEKFLDNKELLNLLSIHKSSHNFDSSKGFGEKIVSVDTYVGEIIHQILPSIFSSHVSLTRKKSYALLNKIKDYTVKLKFKSKRGISWGTGWFLDYEIPEGSKKYPTKWFIATSAKLLSNFKFKSNPFRQNIQSSLLDAWFQQMELGIYKERRSSSLQELPHDEYPEVWTNKDKWKNIKSSGSRKISFSESKNVSYEEIKGTKAFKLTQDPSVVYTSISDPFLFYVPINFLGKDISSVVAGESFSQNYYKNFSIIEVNFDDESTARKVTDDFYFKQQQKDFGNTLDLFSSDLSSKYSGEELLRNEERYYSLGYPLNSYNVFKSFGNYSHIDNSSSKLITHCSFNSDSKRCVKNKYGQTIVGHINEQHIEDTYRKQWDFSFWNDESISNFGYQYTISQILGPGAEGSLVVNMKGEVLGIVSSSSLYETENDKPFTTITPLRSSGLFDKGKIIQPNYDLITGSKGQIGSYKEQLDKHYPKLKTFLRSKYWNK